VDHRSETDVQALVQGPVKNLQGTYPMTKVLDDVLAANEAYVAGFGDKGSLAMPPARRFAILTCMDARLDPAKFAGLAEGDAHVIRNAGGRASDDASARLLSPTSCLARTSGS
jgi:carbonic anhydrase